MNCDLLAAEFEIDHVKLFNKFIKTQSIKYTGKSNTDKLEEFSKKEKNFLSCMALQYLEENVKKGLLEYPESIYLKKIELEENDDSNENIKAIPIDQSETFTMGEVEEYIAEKCAACPAREYL